MEIGWLTICAAGVVLEPGYEESGRVLSLGACRRAAACLQPFRYTWYPATTNRSTIHNILYTTTHLLPVLVRRTFQVQFLTCAPLCVSSRTEFGSRHWTKKAHPHRVPTQWGKHRTFQKTSHWLRQLIHKKQHDRAIDYPTVTSI